MTNRKSTRNRSGHEVLEKNVPDKKLPVSLQRTINWFKNYLVGYVRLSPFTQVKTKMPTIFLKHYNRCNEYR